MGRFSAALGAACVVAAIPAAALAEDDLRKVLEEQERLRKQVEEQQRRIDELEAAARAGAGKKDSVGEAVEAYLTAREAGSPPAMTGLTSKGSKFKLYGFLRLDAMYDDSRMNNTQLPAYVLSEDPTAPPGTGVGPDANQSDFTMHPRLTRLGLDFDGGAVKSLDGSKVAGKLEIDFYGGGSESRAGVRMRHAYLTLAGDEWQLLAGQTQDLIAPLNPAVNNDFVMWGSGNLGDRRPQVRFEFDPKLECGQLFFQGMAGLTGAIDPKDLDAGGTYGNGFRDGETSGRPTLQARAAFRYPTTEKSNLEIGVWGHDAREDPDTTIAGRHRFKSHALGMDASVPLVGDALWIKGEYFQGENLTDVRGGILQGVNTTTGDEIHARGGWAELGFKASGTSTLYLGYAFDDPDEDDLGTGGRDKNKVWYGAVRFNFDPIEVGIEYLNWTTEYVGFDDGTANRIGAYISYKF